MKFCADLHIHSAFSRGTSKTLSLVELKKWARIKGVEVVSTGDFTHPSWRQELKEKLIADGSGFLILPDSNVEKEKADFWKTAENPLRFCLSTEISSIYKKKGQVRKVHSLILVPDFLTAERICLKLEVIGNLKADGRPILGLDPKHLLEIIKEISLASELIPAHIWTPWFSILGAHSGFDSIEECFEDLTGEIFALETGLSSDPLMNGRLSALDRFTLVSNSDAHSASRLMREANLFETELSYSAMVKALKTNQGFLGTIEFFPEEGKYHYDGHRKCRFVLNPEYKFKGENSLCPNCGKPLTIGVMHRVLQLADRALAEIPASRKNFTYLIPLEELIAEINGTNPKSKAVQNFYRQAIEKAGSERVLLFEFPLEEIKRQIDPLLALAIERLRLRQVDTKAGYDGEYGIVRVFKPGELEMLRGQALFSGFELNWAKPKMQELFKFEDKVETEREKGEELKALQFELDSEQKKAVANRRGAVMILAGPGSGKTQTLASWLAACLTEDNQKPETVCAITFTCKARDELQARLLKLVDEQAKLVTINTFHGLAFKILADIFPNLTGVFPQESRRELLAFLFPQFSANEIARFARQIEDWFENPQKPNDSKLNEIIRPYLKALEEIGAIDISALLSRVNAIFETRAEIASYYRNYFKVIAVDEFQDCNHQQYRFLNHLIGISVKEEGRKALYQKSILVIGDPQQSIYSFRGADPNLFFRFQNDYQASFLVLNTNYRSQALLVEAACALISHHKLKTGLNLKPARKPTSKITIWELSDEEQEANFIANLIQSLIGGTDLLAEQVKAERANFSFADIAILARTNSILHKLAPTLIKQGIPVYQANTQQILADSTAACLYKVLRYFFNQTDPFAFQQLLQIFLPHLTQLALTHFLKAFKRRKPRLETLLGLLEEVEVSQNLLQADKKYFESLVRFLQFVEAEIEEQGVAKGLFLLGEKIAESERNSPVNVSFCSLLDLARLYGTNFKTFLADLFLALPEGNLHLPVEKVPLLTLHSAKGLEFPIVIIVGCEDEIIPLKQESMNLEEERRLFFVGLTRAREKLYLTKVDRRNLWGKPVKLNPSTFLEEIPGHTKEIRQLKRKRTVYQPSFF